MYALLALAALAGTWAIGEIFDLWGNDDDPDTEQPPEAVELTGSEGTVDLLTGGDGNDTLAGNPAENDTLIGGAGDDLLMLAPDNAGQGDAGADTFQVYRDAWIDDYTPGEDRLEIVNFTDSRNEDFPDAYFWRSGGDGVGLYSISETTGTESMVVFLPTLTTPPPIEDITEIRIDDRLGETTRVTGADINFVERFTGTDGGDSLTMDGPRTICTADMGAGDDSVTFDAVRGTTDLGPGNDTYASTGASFPPIPGTAQDIARGGAGNDTFTPGQLRNSLFEGGDGDDLFDLTDYSDAGFARADGGAGDDTFLMAMNARATGGAGADTFTVLNPFANGEVTDFDPAEDVIALAVSPGYSGAGNISLRINADDTTSILLDGANYLTVTGALTDTAGIVLLTDPQAAV
jgi:Ca2+-binding RTX toxin-like protein